MQVDNNFIAVLPAATCSGKAPSVPEYSTVMPGDCESRVIQRHQQLEFAPTVLKPFHVEIVNGKTITPEAQPSVTIENVKQIIHHKEAFPRTSNA